MKYLNAPCNNCPYLKKGGVRLRHARIKDLLANLADFSSGGVFNCHKTVHRDESDEEDDDSDEISGPSKAFCGGALIFAEKQGWSNAMMRVGGRLGLYRPDDVKPAAKKRVFDTSKQMYATAEDAKQVKAKQRAAKRSGTGEPCSVANENCEAPAGWSAGGGLIENDEANAQFECSNCREPVCGACSREVRHGGRMCDECAGSESIVA